LPSPICSRQWRRTTRRGGWRHCRYSGRIHVRVFLDGYKAVAWTRTRRAGLAVVRGAGGAAEASIQREVDSICRAVSMAADDDKLT